jgi:beta-lactam-binding protein with PASTA domain
MKLGKARFVAAVAPLALAGLAFAVPAMAASSASAQTAAPTHAPAALVRVPAVTFDPAQEAINEIEAAGLVPVVHGAVTGAFVNTQSPVAGRTVPAGSTVTLVTIKGPTP